MAAQGVGVKHRDLGLKLGTQVVLFSPFLGGLLIKAE